MGDRPNILLICNDQQRHDYLGYAGATWVRTPNLDRLAERGTVFTHAYTNSPLCVPARCALATGLLPHRYAGMFNHSYMPMRLPTLYRRLREGGYWTGFVGKLDLVKPAEKTGPDGRLPVFEEAGFSEACLAATSMVPMKTPENAYLWHLEKRGLWERFNEDRRARCPLPGLVDVGFYGFPPVDLRTAGLPKDWVIRVSQDLPFAGDDHHDHFCASKALEWLEKAPPGRPWFLQVNFCGPHEPFDPPREYGERYRKAEVPEAIPADLMGKPRNMRDRFITDDAESIRYTRRQYCAMIEHLDAQVGRLVERLEQRGELENTVIIFTADHGEMLGDFGLYTKHVPYEASGRIPLMMCGPGIAAGRRSDALVELMDLNPTCCQLAGLPVQKNIDARSMMPLAREKPEPSTSAARENAVMVMYNFAALRTRRWKYARHYNDLEELYDLEADPQERHNLIADAAGQREHTALRWQLLGALNGRMNEGGWTR